MAATSRGIVASAALQGRVVADFNKSLNSRSSSSPRSRGFVMPSSRSFRAFRTIKKSPRLNRSASRVVMRISSAPSAMQGGSYLMAKEQPRWGFDNFMSKDMQEDNVMFKFDNDDDEEAAGLDENGESSSAMVETVNAVLADIVDGQKYIKETGRTKPRPMKRRALVVSLALGAFRGPLNDVDSRLGSLRRTPSTTRLSRTPSASGFARTAHLMSQLSFGSPHGTDMH